VETWDAFITAVEDGKFVMAHWDGTFETEKEIKEETGATIRCIPFDVKSEDGVCIKTGRKSVSRVLFAKAY
jgi:prolyl-tRNA synthetase